MLRWECVCITTVAGRLPYIDEEVYQARYVLHTMEYQVWEAWRQAWSQQESPVREQFQRQALFDVSGRLGLSIPLVQEIVRYAENRVWLAMTNDETKI
ncbi:hypothetical protein [Marinococcus halotolerans]|jgi:hypothetical protein|uniref:hypothetical protein n=1 Tax=Marinococcus halotolerans TaxID=301092 RepID=UPI0003B440B6|nr:hypothetical protein [Marinococcus halotolerans]